MKPYADDFADFIEEVIPSFAEEVTTQPPPVVEFTTVDYLPLFDYIEI